MDEANSTNIKSAEAINPDVKSNLTNGIIQVENILFRYFDLYENHHK